MLYVVRHGQTDWNLAHKVQGLTDIPLNETGIEQAKVLKEKLKDIKFTKIFSSPLKRAKKTAMIIAGSEDGVYVDDRLIERCMGNYEGKDPIVMAENREKIWDYSIENEIEKVENIKNLTRRINDFLDEYNEVFKNDNVLIVTHMNVLPAINAYFNGIPNDNQMTRSRLNNCEVIKYGK